MTQKCFTTWKMQVVFDAIGAQVIPPTEVGIMKRVGNS